MDEIKIYASAGDSSKMVTVTEEELENLVLGTQRITEITISYARKLNTENYQSEDFHESIKLNFDWFWNRIPQDLMAVPKSSQIVNRAFANAAVRSVGVALRGMYINHLYSVASRASQLKLSSFKSIQMEVAQVNTQHTFDPMDVVQDKTGGV